MISLMYIVVVFSVPALLIFAALYDVLTMTIPNYISISMTAAFFAAALLSGFGAEQLLLHSGAGLAVLAVGIGFFAAGWVGGGDVKLAAATSLWLGFDFLLEYLFVASLYGGLLTFMVLALRNFPLPAFATRWVWLDRLHDPSNGVPYGVALAIGGILVFPTSPIWATAFTG